MKIVILCTGNSCRSQMAHGFLQSFKPDWMVRSAGTEATGKLNSMAVEVMKEVGIDISHHTSDNVEKYLNKEWDYVITVCGGANESCPAFTGKVEKRLHIGFDDPSEAKGSPEFIHSEFVRIRDEIRQKFYELMKTIEADSKQALKELVKQRYNEVALLSTAKASKCCCNPAAPSQKVFTIMREDYSQLKGYEPDADLGVGCGLPTQYAGIKEGDTVVDLGSGAGNDCFIAREEVGETGKVIGIDFAPNMLSKARRNAEKRGFKNIEFLEGDIENMPLPDASVDVVVSNCVLNLLPRKDRIFNEIYRVLKPGAHFCVSDVVLNGIFPKEFTDNAAMYAGCIASAIQREEYLGEIEKAGFKNIQVARTKTVCIPNDVLEEHLDKTTIEKYKAGNTGIYSITVTGVKD